MRYKTVIEYDGSGFHGWQRQQPGCRTVQAEFERAAEHMTGAPVTVVASGRTDEGVHALGQVVHFDCGKEYPPDVMMRALNHWLPEDVRVLSCEIVADTFDARRSAKRKTYEYVMYTAGVESPLRRTRELYIGRSADAELMDSAARLLVGTHDFSAFMSSGSSAKTFTRTIYSAEVRTAGDRIVFRITGSGFLYNMVRIIVGALVRIGMGEKTKEEIALALGTGDRRLMPDIAPPQALYLVGAEYIDVG